MNCLKHLAVNCPFPADSDQQHHPSVATFVLQRTAQRREGMGMAQLLSAAPKMSPGINQADAAVGI